MLVKTELEQYVNAWEWHFQVTLMDTSRHAKQCVAALPSMLKSMAWSRYFRARMTALFVWLASEKHERSVARRPGEQQREVGKPYSNDFPHPFCGRVRLYRQGDACARRYVIARGRIKLSRVNANGSENTLIILRQEDSCGAYLASDSVSPDMATAKGITRIPVMPSSQLLAATRSSVLVNDY